MSNPAAVSREIARNFLQTVVIVDDRADLRFGDPPSPVVIAPTMEDAAPAVADMGDADLDVDSQSEVADAAPRAGLTVPSDDELSVAEHGDLDAKAIIDHFASLGLVCGVIRPEQSEDVGPIVDPAAQRADVLVLDWWMHGDGGAASKEIISDIARSDGQQNRIRLVIIYTAVTDLRNVAADVASVLEGATLVAANRVFAGSLRVVVLAKPDTQVEATFAGDVVPFGEFADRVVAEFASVVEGLLSNVAFAALAAIRGNTYGILTRFDRALDPAYLGHRMLLPSPEDSEEHLVELVLQELSAVMESAEVGKRADFDAISGFVDDEVLAIDDVENLALAAARHGVSVSDLAMHLVKEGVWSPNYELSRSERKGLRDWISKVFSLSSDVPSRVSDDINEQWSMLMSSKMQYGAIPPRLRLGVLVRNSSTDQFLLCMQPVCDSVRLTEQTSFPFLPLDETPSNWDLALAYSGGYHLLKLRFRIRDLFMAAFTPSADSSGVVRAERSGDGQHWVFIANDDQESFEWVGELRDNFAQKFANRFGESVSRVGVNESEWLRLAK